MALSSPHAANCGLLAKACLSPKSITPVSHNKLATSLQQARNKSAT